MLCGLGGLYLGYEAVAQELRHGDLTKLGLGVSALRVAIAFPWLGAGRGAFPAVFPLVGEVEPGNTHPENLLAQWTGDWGLPVALILLGFLGAGVIRAMRSRRLMVAAGAVSLAAWAAHDLVDFSLELAGVAVVAAFLGGAVISSPSKKSAKTPVTPSAQVWGLGAALTGLALWAALSDPGTGHRSAHLLALEASQWELGRNPVALQSELRRHPLDPGLTLLGAWQALRSRRPDAARWLNRAMLLAPQWAAPHVLSAHWLNSIGARGQAALEVRQAETRRPGSAVAVA